MKEFLKTGLCLIFCISSLITTAFGADVSTYEVSSDELIDDPAYIILDNSKAEYNAYKILGLQLEQICDHTAIESHTEDCYNYLYSANEKYMEAFYQFAPDMNSDEVFNDTDVVYYVSAVWDDEELSNNMAKSLYEQIQAMNLLPDAVIGGTIASNLDQGYYLIVNADDETDDLTLLDTMGYATISLKETASSEVENYVQANEYDINEGDMMLITNNYDGYLGSATYHTGDIVSFKAKYNIDEIKQYPCTIGVELSDGLNFTGLGQNLVDIYATDSSSGFYMVLNDISEARSFAANGVIEIVYNARLMVNAPYRSVSTAYIEYEDTKKTSIASVYTYSLKVYCTDNIQFELLNTEKDISMGFDLEDDTYIFNGIASGEYRLVAYNNGVQTDSIDFDIASLTHKSYIGSMGVSESDAFSTDEANGVIETVYSDNGWISVESAAETEETNARSFKAGTIAIAVIVGIVTFAVCYVVYSEKKLHRSKKG